MIHLDDSAKQAGDIAASIGAAIAVLSHWAQVLTPIVTLLIGLLTMGWWIARYWEHLSGEDD